MLKELNRWFDTFTGAICMAVFCFLCMLGDISAGSVGVAWLMGAVTVYWLYRVWKAIKNKAVNATEVELTPDQIARIEEASKEFHAALEELEREVVQDAREKAGVQSNERTDTKAGSEGTDGRTDSEEDRTP